MDGWTPTDRQTDGQMDGNVEAKRRFHWTVCVQDRGKWKYVVEKAKTFNI